MTGHARSKVLLMLALAACARPHSSPPPAAAPIVSPASEARGARIWVGTSTVDVTPPPGSSLFGHGPGGRVAIGHWTRLYCRPFYIEREGQANAPLVIVPCELPQVSTHLQQSIAAEAAARGVNVDASRLMLTATHTHAGPGHFFGVKNLNGYTSSPFPGYDPRIVDFIARRVARGIEEARESRQPAELRWVRENVVGLSRNAAVWQTKQNKMQSSEMPSCIGDAPEDMRLVDHSLRLLEFRRTSNGNEDAAVPIGAIAFYALHPTFIGNRNRYYHGDVLGVASRLVEHELRREWAQRCGGNAVPGAVERWASESPCGNAPVLAFINTNEADAQPVRTSGSQEEVRKFGTLLASAIWHAHLTRAEGQGTPPAPHSSYVCDERAGPWVARPTIRNRYVQLWLPGAKVPAQENEALRLCPYPEMGVGSSKGSPANPSVVKFIAPGSDGDVDWERNKKSRRRWSQEMKENDECQHPKRKLQRGGFSEEVPLALLEIEGTLVSFVPAETTVATGALINGRVRAAAESTLKRDSWDAVIAGLANGYISYVATFGEYQVQAYHGASTLYGPQSAAFLAGSFDCLTHHLLESSMPAHCQLMGRNGPAPFDVAYSIDVVDRPKRQRFWRPRWDDTWGGKARPPEIKNPLCSLPESTMHNLCFTWVGDGPYASMAMRKDGTEAPGWLVALEQRDGNGWKRVALSVPPLPELRPGALELGGSAGAPQGPSQGITAWADDTGIAFTTRVHRREKSGGWRWSTVISLTKSEWAELRAIGEVRVAVLDGTSNAEFDANDPPPPCLNEVQNMRQFCSVEY